MDALWNDDGGYLRRFLMEEENADLRTKLIERILDLRSKKQEEFLRL